MDSSAVSSIKEILVEHWDNAFHVLEHGSSLDIYVELENTSESTGLWKHIPMVVEKKHIMIFKVPPGYIEGFVKDNK
jgi:dTDP-4-dehydrorhamnose 3,5-epimerase-like enzyme